MPSPSNVMLAADPTLSEQIAAAMPDREQLLTYGGEAISTCIVLLAALALYLLVSRLLSRLYHHSHLDKTMVSALRTVTRWLFFVLTVAAVLQVWDVLDQFWAAITAFVTLIAVGFVAVWSVLSNILCSIILLASRPFRIGQTIELPPDELGGTVSEITLLHTILVTPAGDELKIPNNLFFQRVIRLKRGGDEPTFEQANSVEV